MSDKEKMWPETLPQEWQDALVKLYNKFGSNQTTEQKLNILATELGECSVSSTSDWRRSETEIQGTKLNILEAEYLIKIGLYEPEYC